MDEAEDSAARLVAAGVGDWAVACTGTVADVAAATAVLTGVLMVGQEALWEAVTEGVAAEKAASKEAEMAGAEGMTEAGMTEGLEEQSTNNHPRCQRHGRDVCYPECNRSNPFCLSQVRSIHTLFVADVRKGSRDIARCSSIKVAMMGRSTPWIQLRVQEWGSTKTPTSRRSAAAGGTSDYISRRCVGGGGCACEDGTRKNTHSLIII